MVGGHGKLSLPRFHRSWRRLRAAWTLQGAATLPHIFGSIAQYFDNHCTTFALLLYDKKLKVKSGLGDWTCDDCTGFMTSIASHVADPVTIAQAGDVLTVSFNIPTKFIHINVDVLASYNETMDNECSIWGSRDIQLPYIRVSACVQRRVTPLTVPNW